MNRKEKIKDLPFICWLLIKIYKKKQINNFQKTLKLENNDFVEVLLQE